MKLKFEHSIAFACALLSYATAHAEFSYNTAQGPVTEDIIKEIPAGETIVNISGNIGIDDLIALQTLPASVNTLNLGQAEIVDSEITKGDWYGFHHFEAGNLPQYIFHCSPLTTVTLPSSLKTIDDSAFSGAAIKSLSIPDGVTSIASHAFRNCPALASVDGGKALSSIGEGIFTDCTALKDVNLSQAHITILPRHAFAGCSSLMHISLPASITAIEPYALYGTPLTSLQIPGVNSLLDYSLAGLNHLESITIPSGTQLGQGVFVADSSLSNVEGINPLIPQYTFAGCPALDISSVLADASDIGKNAFAACSADTIILGANVASIGENAFRNVTGLATINAVKLENNTPAVTDKTFSTLDCPKISLVVTPESAELWKATPYWNQFNIVTTDTDSIDEIGDASGISFAPGADSIFISAQEPLTSVTAYAADGTLIHQSSPASTTAEIALPSSPSAIIIITASTSGASRTAKFILR